MYRFVLLLLGVLPLLMWSKAEANDHEREGSCVDYKIVNIGAVIDLNSRVGKEQKIAMEIAIQDVNHLKSCYKLVLNFNDSFRNPSRVVAADLANKKKVQAIIGTKLDGAALVNEIDESSKNIPIISLTSSSSSEITVPIPLPYFIQIGNDITLQLQCIAAILGQFNWRKVTAIYEHDNGFTSYSDILTKLTYALRHVGFEIDHHVAFPSIATLLDPAQTIEVELRKLKNKSNRVFLIIQSSLEFSNLLFEKVMQMGLMGKGSVWIIADDLASHLDSMDSSVTSNMQGVVGCKTSFMETSRAFKRFKFMFRSKFGLEYPEEESPLPSIFALRAYDAIWAVAHAPKKSQANFSSEELSTTRTNPCLTRCGRLNESDDATVSCHKSCLLWDELSENILSSNHEGLSGKISFKDRRLLESPTFKIVNVIGRSYKELAYWSPESGFLENLVNHEEMKTTTTTTSAGSGSGSGRVLLGNNVNWPGGMQTVPKGWVYSNEGKPLKIGVPAGDPCPHFVNVTYDRRLNETNITGFSISVFKSVVKLLPYHITFDLVPFYGSYDEIVEQVNNKVFDAAVGDLQVIDHRYAYTEFSQPYIPSGISMVVKVKPDRSKETWMFMEAFTKEMWLLMVTLHMSIAFVIWLIEREDNLELMGFEAMLWFSVTIFFFLHREPVKSGLARAVLAPWLFAILVVTACFTASLSSMMTVSQLEPSVPDIQTLLRTNAVVGCNKVTFLVHYLVEELKFKPENVRGFESISDFPRAFENNEIKAAFTIAPHAQVFLATHCKGYIQAGPTLKLGGLGFAFPKGSALAIDISRATLKAIESGEVQKLEEEMLSTTNCGSPTKSQKIQNVELGPRPFFGLFGICGTIAAFAFSVTIVPLVGKKAQTLLQRGLRVASSCVGRHLNKYMRSAPAQDVNSPGNIPSAKNEQNIVNIELPITPHS